MKLPLVTLLAAAAAAVHGSELTVDCAKSAGPVSPTLYGLMTEEINHSYDGGLYGELVRNWAFLNDPHAPADWSVVQDAGAEARMALDSGEPLNKAIPVSLRVDVARAADDRRAGIANTGYWGIPVRPGATYHASFFAKGRDYSGRVAISIESDDGRTVYAEGGLAGVTGAWRRYEITLRTAENAPTAKARYVLRLDRPGTVWFSLVSLFPPTWNDRPNGLRPDLMKMLVDLHPKFLRFPGGNYLEGLTIADRFPWKKTIGPISRRPGHMGPWGYRSTDGMGLLEFLEWCEDMGAQPVLAVYAGYSLEGQRVAPGKDLAPFVQSALDEIEYVTGDPAKTQWGARRAQDGHPAPFPLRYVEIGNEDGFDKAHTYDARFAQFFDAIKARYPELQCIATTAVRSRRPDVVDDHYYDTEQAFLRMGRSQYEKRDRAGPKVFVGEWAAYETPFAPWKPQSAHEPPTANLRAALGDAAFMTDLERNSDLVVMHCYAPLLVNVDPGARQWRPDLIGYDALNVFGSPSYYAFKMFSTHVGNERLRVTEAGSGVFASATRAGATGEIYLKLVNPASSPAAVPIRLVGASHLAPTARAIVLSAPSVTATNSITAPRNVVPVTETVRGVASNFTYTAPANAVIVLVFRSR